MSEDKIKEILVKIEKAKATLDDALFLIENDKKLMAVNRLYYSIFYILCALAEKYDFGTSNHTQLIGWFNKNFVAENKIDKDVSKTVHRLFDMRTKADYDFYSEFDITDIKNFIMKYVFFLTKY